MSVETIQTSQSDTLGSSDYLTVTIAGQLFGIPVLQVQDVLSVQALTKIPLAPPEVAGSLNLRGRIVTAINVRKRLQLEGGEGSIGQTSVVVEHGDELYSLIIDSVGDVLTLKKTDYEENPATLDAKLKDISVGIYRVDEKLLMVVDVPKLLESVDGI